MAHVSRYINEKPPTKYFNLVSGYLFYFGVMGSSPKRITVFLVRGHVRFIKIDGGDGVENNPFT